MYFGPKVQRLHKHSGSPVHQREPPPHTNFLKIPSVYIHAMPNAQIVALRKS